MFTIKIFFRMLSEMFLLKKLQGDEMKRFHRAIDMFYIALVVGDVN